MSYIQVHNVAKLYGDGDAAVTAVTDMSFTIEAGQFVAVMGQSGSGKSTLLSILGALNTPTAGKLLVDNVDVYAMDHDERADFRRESVGFIFQNFNIWNFQILHVYRTVNLQLFHIDLYMVRYILWQARYFQLM